MSGAARMTTIIFFLTSLLPERSSKSRSFSVLGNALKRNSALGECCNPLRIILSLLCTIVAFYFQKAEKKGDSDKISAGETEKPKKGDKAEVSTRPGMFCASDFLNLVETARILLWFTSEKKSVSIKGKTTSESHWKMF